MILGCGIGGKGEKLHEGRQVYAHRYEVDICVARWTYVALFQQRPVSITKDLSLLLHGVLGIRMEDRYKQRVRGGWGQMVMVVGRKPKVFTFFHPGGQVIGL